MQRRIHTFKLILYISYTAEGTDAQILALRAAKDAADAKIESINANRLYQAKSQVVARKVAAVEAATAELKRGAAGTIFGDMRKGTFHLNLSH